MFRYFSFVVVVAFLLSSINGLLPLGHVLHDHLLLGPVTAEQLRAHEAAEAAETQPLPVSPDSASESNITITLTGGLIVSLASHTENLVSAPQFDGAVWFYVALVAPLAFYLIPTLPVLTQFRILPALDPPPRFSLASF